MKTLVKFYPVRSLSWTNKTSGEVKHGFLQPYDLDQGANYRPFQGEVMRMNQAECVAPGVYECEVFLEKQSNGRIDVRFDALRSHVAQTQRAS